MVRHSTARWTVKKQVRPAQRKPWHCQLVGAAFLTCRALAGRDRTNHSWLGTNINTPDAVSGETFMARR